MRKQFFVCLAAIVMALMTMTSCNDDVNTPTDSRIAKDLPGTWVMNDNNVSTTGGARSAKFVFTNSGFSLEYYRKAQSSVYSYSVSGTWKVFKETLELTYNVSTLTTIGMTKSEIDDLMIVMNDNNSNLNDKPDTTPLGMNIEVSRSYATGTGIMRLSGYNPDLVGVYNYTSETPAWPPTVE